MKQINYILVNETSSKNADCAISNSMLPSIRHSNIVVAPRKWQVPGSKERRELLDQLVFLRHHNPDAKILGISELGNHCVYPSERMNQLRRELSDYP